MNLKIIYIGPLKGGQYYPTECDKKTIILHHTAGGSAKEAVNWWNQTPDAVGTALLVERDGSALQCFEIDQWAWSLGLKIVNNETKIAFEKQSVGIELVSYGWVLPEGDKFYAYPLWPNKTRRVLIPKDQVVQLDKPWRGYKFYHKYTKAQIETTVALCRYLVNRFKIKIQDSLDGFWDYKPEVAKEKKSGIYSHTTVRTDKVDIYPDVDLIQALKKEFKK